MVMKKMIIGISVALILVLVAVFALFVLALVFDDHPLAEFWLPHEYIEYNGINYYPADYLFSVPNILETEDGKRVVYDCTDVKVKVDGKLSRTKKLYSRMSENIFILDQESYDYKKIWYISENANLEKYISGNDLGEVSYEVTPFFDSQAIRGVLHDDEVQTVRQALLNGVASAERADDETFYRCIHLTFCPAGYSEEFCIQFASINVHENTIQIRNRLSDETKYIDVTDDPAFDWIWTVIEGDYSE